jgi:acetyl-CoA synthetase
MYDKITAAGAGRAIVVRPGDLDLRESDVSWDDFLADDDAFEPVVCDMGDATNILFSSGTTGEPKAIVWSHLTPIKAAADGHYHQDIKPGDVVAWPTNLGWMMGPWLIYAALVNQATVALYDDVPSTRGFLEFVSEAGVTMLGVVPSLVAAWRVSGAADGVDLSGVRVVSSTGEASNADDMAWLMETLGAPVIEYCGGTEIGGGYISCTVVQPAVAGMFTTPCLGLDLRIIGEAGDSGGEVFIVPPSIGLSETLLNRDHDAVYYADLPESDVPLRRHGDQIATLPGGYYRAMGRVDDTMNLGGIKVSSAEIERVLAEVDGVAETAAVAISPVGGGPSELVIYIVSAGREVDLDAMHADMQQRIRSHLNPLFKIARVVAIDALPRTASAKVMRRQLRAMAE